MKFIIKTNELRIENIVVKYINNIYIDLLRT